MKRRYLTLSPAVDPRDVPIIGQWKHVDILKDTRSVDNLIKLDLTPEKWIALTAPPWTAHRAAKFHHAQRVQILYDINQARPDGDPQLTMEDLEELETLVTALLTLPST